MSTTCGHVHTFRFLHPATGAARSSYYSGSVSDRKWMGGERNTKEGQRGSFLIQNAHVTTEVAACDFLSVSRRLCLPVFTSAPTTTRAPASAHTHTAHTNTHHTAATNMVFVGSEGNKCGESVQVTHTHVTVFNAWCDNWLRDHVHPVSRITVSKFQAVVTHNIVYFIILWPHFDPCNTAAEISVSFLWTDSEWELEYFTYWWRHQMTAYV